MTKRVVSLVAAFAVCLAGCGDGAASPRTPRAIVVVSGANQVGDPGAPLDSALVIRVVDGTGKAVGGVPVSWAVTGGGSVSSPAATDGDGVASAVWTLSSLPGQQVATVTSSKVGGVSVSFVASNGATISGTVTSAGTGFAADFSRIPSRAGLTRSVARRPSLNRIVVGFKEASLGITAGGSSASRTLTAARETASRMRDRVAALAATHGLTQVQLSPTIRAARVAVTDTSRIDATIAALRTDPSVAWAERDQIVSIRDGAPRPSDASLFVRPSTDPVLPSPSAATKLPNDPRFYVQYWPVNMVDLPRAWALTTGSRSVTVAVVDMGIRFDHPNIAGNLTNDGYDFVSQWAYDSTQIICGGGAFTTIDGDGDGPDADPTDPDDVEFDAADNCWARSSLGDHGLWTAGIVGAVGDQALGVAGVNWTVKIRPIRVLGITGEGSAFDIAQGILYAAGLPALGANGAIVQAPSASPIINMSLGGPGVSTAEQGAVTSAYNAGSLIIASAGNDGLDLPTYPAAFPEVMAVAAVGQDGRLATYSNAGTFISVAAPGGDFRLMDNTGGGIAGLGWNFVNNAPTYLFGYGTSAAAPFVSGIAALILAQTPSLTPAQLRQRIEQFAVRPPGTTRGDLLGWGLVNAYNALTQQNGPPRKLFVRLIDQSTGEIHLTGVSSTGAFAFTRLANGPYYLQGGEDESGDGRIGVAGRRFGWAGGFGTPTVYTVNRNTQTTAFVVGTPTEVEPNDDPAHANTLSVGSYVTGQITPPDVRDVYTVAITKPGTYTFETSGVVGTCGLGIELDTYLSLALTDGTIVGSNAHLSTSTGVYCARLTLTLPGNIYYVTVTGVADQGGPTRGRYRLEVREGT